MHLEHGFQLQEVLTLLVSLVEVVYHQRQQQEEVFMLEISSAKEIFQLMGIHSSGEVQVLMEQFLSSILELAHHLDPPFMLVQIKVQPTLRYSKILILEPQRVALQSS